jgi:hypothetical protein
LQRAATVARDEMPDTLIPRCKKVRKPRVRTVDTDLMQ